ncbi:MAG: ADP-glyceromanno-heptose 6-epimerase [Sinobacteraceae bacterium]|nr:ADP-glyceromanno-heptose 6-epimerase [Nevskiaceae bacterium]MBV9318192.1 ADP-glyceromanno-heptose 6-epimerase [Gammaproteobacteria bacterium]
MILVTGGAGFIGSNIVAALTARGERIAVCDRLRQADKWRNLSHAALSELIAPEALPAWLAGQAGQLEAVVHMGAISSTTERDVDLIIEVNFRLSQALWRWCALEGKRFIYASSAATYGGGEQGFDDDPRRLPLLRPLNAYGWSKHLFDRWVAQMLAAGEPAPPQWVGLKFFNVYGPNEYHKGTMRSVIAQKYPLAASGQPVTLFRSHRSDVPDGGQKRDFIYVRDCVEVVQWLLSHPEVKGLYNLGSGRARSFADLAHALFAALQRPPRIEYIDTPEAVRAHYQYFTEARMERLHEVGYTGEFTSLEAGVADYVQRYLSQSDPYL